MYTIRQYINIKSGIYSVMYDAQYRYDSTLTLNKIVNFYADPISEIRPLFVSSAQISLE